MRQRKKNSSMTGQSTVEYVLVLTAFLAMILAFGALWNVLSEGLVVDHAIQSASHNMVSAAGSWADFFLY